MDTMKVLLAGGGTAGHIEPALAIARALRHRDSSVEILFLGTKEGLETTLIPAAGFDITYIPKVVIPRHISVTILSAPFQLFKAIRETKRALQGVDVAIGFGGYVSAPLYCAAFLAKIPFVIHEQNAKPGWANRVGGYLTSYKAISYPVAKGSLASATLTGLPLRQDVVGEFEEASDNWELARERARELLAERYNLRRDDKWVFVFGGSQGSLAINAIVEKSRNVLNEKKISIIHGVGKKNATLPEESRYRALNYIDDMALHYLAADISIARSGAVSCAEITALGRYAIFIPLPVGNGEQALNAQSLVAQGRAVVIEQSQFTSEWLVANIEEYLKRSEMTPIEGDGSSITAADKIVEIIYTASGVK